MQLELAVSIQRQLRERRRLPVRHQQFRRHDHLQARRDVPLGGNTGLAQELPVQRRRRVWLGSGLLPDRRLQEPLERCGQLRLLRAQMRRGLRLQLQQLRVLGRPELQRRKRRDLFERRLHVRHHDLRARAALLVERQLRIAGTPGYGEANASHCSTIAPCWTRVAVTP